MKKKRKEEEKDEKGRRWKGKDEGETGEGKLKDRRVI